MKPHLRFGAAIVAALATGYFVGRETPTADPTESSAALRQASNFEGDALGFLNWFRLSGRNEIPKSELLRNLQILESKAIASGKLIAFRGTPTDGEPPGVLNPDRATD